MKKDVTIEDDKSFMIETSYHSIFYLIFLLFLSIGIFIHYVLYDNKISLIIFLLLLVVFIKKTIKYQFIVIENKLIIIKKMFGVKINRKEIRLPNIDSLQYKIVLLSHFLIKHYSLRFFLKNDYIEFVSVFKEDDLIIFKQKFEKILGNIPKKLNDEK